MDCVFPPNIMPLLQNLYIIQEDVNSIEAFWCGSSRSVSLSCVSFLSPSWRVPAPWVAGTSCSQPGFWSHLSSGDKDGSKQISLSLSHFCSLGVIRGCRRKSSQLFIVPMKNAHTVNPMCRGTTKAGGGKAALSKENNCPFWSTMCGQNTCTGTCDNEAWRRFLHIDAHESVYAWLLPCVKWHQN